MEITKKQVERVYEIHEQIHKLEKELGEIYGEIQFVPEREELK